jgi:opacity protein-like surface antigen
LPAGVAAVVAIIISSAAAADVVEERLTVPMTIVAGAASTGAGKHTPRASVASSSFPC